MKLTSDTPLVSVIILCYNQADIIGRAIESVLSQTYQNIQLVIVDDCSKDHSRQVIGDWQTKYPGKIKTYFQPSNVGHPANMNTGYRLCDGELITFCDGDDWYFPEKVGREVQCLKNNSDADVVYSNFDFYTIDGKFLRHWALKEASIPQEDIFLRLFSLDYPYRSHLRYEMTSKKILEEIGFYDESIPIWVDWDLRLRLAAKYKFVYSHYIGSAYTENPAGLTNVLKQETILNNLQKVINKNKSVLEKYPAEDVQKALRSIGLIVQRQILALNIRKGETSLVKTLQFVISYPAELKNWRFILNSIGAGGLLKKLSVIKKASSLGK